jgi:hypothetical protein
MTEVFGMLLASRMLKPYRVGKHGDRYPES